ncbi:unnamed protein product [Rotaria sp. Silwood2]|nr:unnamed protein product [Rotaria sp. Silwood2]
MYYLCVLVVSSDSETSNHENQNSTTEHRKDRSRNYSSSQTRKRARSFIEHEVVENNQLDSQSESSSDSVNIDNKNSMLSNVAQTGNKNF